MEPSIYVMSVATQLPVSRIWINTRRQELSLITMNSIWNVKLIIVIGLVLEKNLLKFEAFIMMSKLI